MKIFFDIETVPNYANREEYSRVKNGLKDGTFRERGPEFYRHEYGALNPFEGKTVLITYQVDEGKPQYLKEWKADEPSILRKFYDALNQPKERVTLVGFNIAKFDLPFLFARIINHKKEMSLSDADMVWVFKRLLNFVNVVDLMQLHLPSNNFTYEGMVHDVLATCYDCQTKIGSGSDVKEHYYTEPEGMMEYVEKEFIYQQMFAKMLKDGLVGRDRLQSVIKDSNAKRSRPT